MDRNVTNHDGELPREGWPLFNRRQTFATVANFFASLKELPGYNYPELRKLGYESVIAGIPHFLGLKLAIGDQIYDSSMDLETIIDFETTWNLKDGINTWRLTWTPKDLNISLNIETTTLVHRTQEHRAATQMQVTAHGGDVNCTVIDIFDGRSAVRSKLQRKGLFDNTPSMHISLHPEGQPNVTAYLTSTANVSNGYTGESSRRLVEDLSNSNNMTIGQAWDVHLMEGKPAIFVKFVGIASTDEFPAAENISQEESLGAYRDGFDAILEPHIKEWNKIMARNHFTNYRDPVNGRLPENDTVITAFQANAAVDHFTMMQTLRTPGKGQADTGVAVGGLYSDTYGGMTYWDQDVWMLPAIVHTAPQHARQMVLARAKQLPQAKANVQAEYVQAEYKFPKEAALFPWSAGKFGNATATGPVLNYEYHSNAGIALANFEYLYATGDEDFFRDRLWNTTLAIGYAFDTLMIPDGNGYSIFNMTGPDEFHVSDSQYLYLCLTSGQFVSLVT